MVANRRITISGVRLHYRVAGRGLRGTPLVCLAAPGDSSGSLVPLLRRFGERRLSFALDLPGHGRSGNPPSGRVDPAWWLLAWMQRLRFERCHLVTIDGTLGVGVDASQRSSRHVASLSVVAPPLLSRRAATEQARSSLARARQLPRNLRMLGSGAARVRSLAASDFVAAMRHSDLERELRFVSAPISVVRGQNDPVSLRDEAAALARTTNGAFIEVPNAPRMCHVSHPGAVALALLAHIDALDQHTSNGRQPGTDAHPPQETKRGT